MVVHRAVCAVRGKETRDGRFKIANRAAGLVSVFLHSWTVIEVLGKADDTIFSANLLTDVLKGRVKGLIILDHQPTVMGSFIHTIF